MTITVYGDHSWRQQQSHSAGAAASVGFGFWTLCTVFLSHVGLRCTRILDQHWYYMPAALKLPFGDNETSIALIYFFLLRDKLFKLTLACRSVAPGIET